MFLYQGNSLDMLLILLLKKKLLTAINTLKNGKAKGLDGIMNEMIKNSREMITPCLLKIVNCILSQSIYPK
jgi:hypothetical protein